MRKIAIILGCLLLTSCAKDAPPTVIEVQPAKPERVPTAYIEPCMKPKFKGVTHGDLMKFTTQIMTALLECDAKITNIRNWDMKYNGSTERNDSVDQR